MTGEVLLDTNIVVALLKSEPAARDRFEQQGEASISIVTLGELLFGAERSQRADDNRQRAEAFADGCTVRGVSRETARRYGVIKKQLKEKGRPIPENDIWIAATAQEHDLVLVTRDPHFQEIDALRLQAW